MRFRLVFSPNADDQKTKLENDRSQEDKLKAVRKCLGFMETNLRHPCLQTHKYYSLGGPHGEQVFESYAQDKTPGAYRIFWYYGPNKGKITIAAIVPHP